MKPNRFSLKQKCFFGLFVFFFAVLKPSCLQAQFMPSDYDEIALIDAYVKKYANESLETLVAMISDDTIDPAITVAAVRLFDARFSQSVFSTEKKRIERWLIRRLARTDSVFVEIEIMHTLCVMDRYKYFNPMMPNLLRRLDHHNDTANALAYDYINAIIQSGQHRRREARIVFNTLRRMILLARRDYADLTEPDDRLRQKINLLRWSIKVLGTEELKKLPVEVLNLF